MPAESLFSARDMALVLIAVNGEMTPEADHLVPQDEWDAVFADGLADTVHPLHGDPYHTLTSTGREYVNSLMGLRDEV